MLQTTLGFKSKTLNNQQMLDYLTQLQNSAPEIANVTPSGYFSSVNVSNMMIESNL